MFFLLPMSMSLADVFEFVVRYCRPVTQCQMIATPLYCVVSILFRRDISNGAASLKSWTASVATILTKVVVLSAVGIFTTAVIIGFV